MAVEDKYISNKTEIINASGELSVRTYYFKEEDIDITAFISQTNQSIESVSFNEGDLGFTINGTLDYFSLINSDLVVVSDDTSKYSIDSDGNLILTT